MQWSFLLHCINWFLKILFVIALHHKFKPLFNYQYLYSQIFYWVNNWRHPYYLNVAEMYNVSHLHLIYDVKKKTSEVYITNHRKRPYRDKLTRFWRKNELICESEHLSLSKIILENIKPTNCVNNCVANLSNNFCRKTFIQFLAG